MFFKTALILTTMVFAAFSQNALAAGYTGPLNFRGKIMKYLLTIIFALIGQTAFAICNGVSCNDVKIEMLYVASGITYLKTNGIEANLDNCVPANGILVSLDHSHPSADKIYALLLTAYTGKLNVKLRFNDTAGNTGPCTIGYAILENN